MLFSAFSIGLLFGAVERPSEAANTTPHTATKVIATSLILSQLRNHLKAAIEKSGMYVFTSESAGRHGIDVPGNLVLDLYRNDFAVRMLNASMQSSIEAPLRFYVTEKAEGTSTLTYRKPSAGFGAYCSANLYKMLAELDAIWAKVVTGTISK